MVRLLYFAVFILFIGVMFLPSLAQDESPEAIMERAGDYYKQGDFNRALEEYQKALSIYEGKNDTLNSGMCYLRSGEVYMAGSRYFLAENSFDKALEIFTSLGDKNLEGDVLIKKGELCFTIGSYEDSLEAYETALKAYKEGGNKTGTGIALDHTGDFYYGLRLYEKALEYHKEALEYFKEEFETVLSAVTICKTGEDYLAMGEEKFGMEKLQEALDIAKYDSSVRYDILMRAAEICRLNKNYELALEMYKEARRNTGEDKNKEKRAVVEIAKTHFLMMDRGTELNDPLGTYEYYRKLGDELGDKKLSLMALSKEGEYCYKSENRDLTEAIKRYELCLAGYKDVEDRWGIIETHQKIGNIYEEMENLEKAEENYKKSIDELEKIRGKIASEEIKKAFLEKAQTFYDSLINLQLKMKKDEEAFYHLETSRARMLLAALIASNVEITSGTAPDLIKQDEKLQGEINLIERKLYEERSQLPQNEDYITQLEKELDILEKELATVHNELSIKDPAYALITGIKKSLTPEEVQNKVLKENQYILEYFINDNERITVWTISKNSLATFEIKISSEELKGRIENFRKPFEELKTDPARFVEILSSLDMENLKALYDILVKPVAAEIPKDSEIIIIPDGMLYYLPFECLVTGTGNTPVNAGLTFSEFGNYRYLIEDYSISYSPSSSTLDPALIKAKKEFSGKYLGVGNPLFEADGENPPPAVGADMLDLMRLQGYSLEALPNTEIEVTKIQHLFKDDSGTSVYIRAKATEENVKNNAPDYKYLLLATHGLLDEHKPMESSLVFSYSSGPKDDGLLKAGEVLNMKLNSDLVVLSACETGLGKIEDGEGVAGLTRAFMYAGAPSIVVSLWSVESGSTAQMMEEFYRNLLAGKNKAEALRQAKLTLMKEDNKLEGVNISYSHPFFWAPFVLMGESN